MMLTREAILASQDIKTERVEVPEWGGYVWVKGLSAHEREQFELAATFERDGQRQVSWGQLQARLVAMTVVDEHGERLFSDADVAILATKSAQAIMRIFAVAQRLAALRAEDLDEIRANFTAIQPDASLSS